MNWLQETKWTLKFSPLLLFSNDSDQSGLCSKFPAMRSVGDTAMNTLLCKSKRE